MGISAGIVGLPNVGKSTIFNALTANKAQAENYPFCTIDPNTGIVAVPDDRLDRITALIETDKIVPAFLELVDIAGLVKGASNGEGLGNQFLGHIKNVNAIVHVVRCFEDEDITHVDGSIDPVRDVETINTELVLKDLETVEKALVRVSKIAKSGDKAAKSAVTLYEKARDALTEGKRIKVAFAEDENAINGLSDLHLITAKDVLYVANVDEAGLEEDNDAVKKLFELAESEGMQSMKLCGKIESEIAELELEERVEFLESLGLEEPGLSVLAKKVYSLLGLETYFTAGKTENKAWTIKKGFTAPQAAGVIHTDFEKGFIKAEVYTIEDLEEYKTETALKAAGKIRQEGKEYVVQDGDIMFFKFNV